IIPYVALTLPLAIFILVTFFSGIPKELEEQGKIDGAGPLRIFLQIVAPLAAPGMGAAAILTFVYATNEFLLAFSFAPRDLNVQTVPVFVGTFQRVGYENPIGQVMAASVLVSVPLVLLALLLQKRISEGLAAGAVKG
ncbi:MAG TPA: carbohydrate ABC transporter permease, partial [Beutenbergiaceae bacterium]|nr:carbohydrate ABC transporter permease [Beutenbergiaceae bacterium]